jgi:hypothetical protein
MIMRAAARLALASLIFAPTLMLEAAMEQHVSAETLAPLKGPLKAGGKVRLLDVPLADGERGTLELEQFDVLAPGATIEVHRENGTVDHVKPQPMRQFRGRIAGNLQSLVYLSVGRDVQGLLLIADRKFSVHSRPRARGRNVDDQDDSDVFIEEIPVHEEALSAGGYTCMVENQMVTPSTVGLPQSLSASGVRAEAFTWLSDTARTTLNMAVDADSAMYANFGNNATTVETYVRNLLGAASTIYRRDLRTDLRITLLSIWTSGGGADPFTIDPNPGAGGSTGTWNGVPNTDHVADHALAEYGDWFHANRAAVKRSAAMLLSGQTERSGIAWIETACSSGGTCSGGNCGSPIYDGHRFGSYSYNGGVGLDGTAVPNPDGGVNFVAPSTNYWSLLQIAHELGHNVQSGHTHCIDTNPGLAGIQPVDACVGGCVPQGAVPVEKGTIMSYCHLRTGGGTNTRYTFGQAGELSEIVITAMRNRLDVITPLGVSTITAPTTVLVGATDVASVTNTAGLTFDWTIVNGTFTGGGTTATGANVSFIGTVDPVLLTVTAMNANGCGLTDTKSVTVEEEPPPVAPAPPTNIVATATGETSVDITWNASVDADEYDVWRSAGEGSFALVGSAGANLFFTDATAAANTSYRYVVRAATEGAFSEFSLSDVATTVVFTDPTVTVDSTKAKAVHFTELLTAVNAMRTLAGLAPVSFTVPAPAAAVTIRRQHLLDLRTGLDAARGVIGLSAISYTDPTITAGSTTIKAVHVTQLRGGVQ